MKIGILHLVCLTALSVAAPSAIAQSTRGTSYLGIGVLDVTPERAKALNLKEERGAEVAHVDEEGPAAKAGIKEGDVVLQYNGESVEGTEQFVRMVRETPVGRQVKLTVWRNGAPQTLTVTVGSRRGAVIQTSGGPVQLPEIPPLPSISVPRFQMSWQDGMLGIEGESLGQQRQLADFFGVKDGVLVKSVMRNSAAEKGGIKAGDVIVKVDGVSVGNTREITSQLHSSRSRKSVAVVVVRDRKENSLTVNLDALDRNGNPPAPPGEKF
jgi:serine protease Do